MIPSEVLSPVPFVRREPPRAVLRGRIARRLTVAIGWAIAHLVPRGASRDALLLVRLDAIGDFIVWLDAAKEFRRLYPDLRILLAANAIWADLATRTALFDEVWPIDVSRFNTPSTYRIATMFRVRRRGFALAIQPTYSRHRFIGDSLVEATGAPDRIGSRGDLSNMSVRERSLADRAYTALVATDDAPMMEIERNAEFVARLSGTRFDGACPALPTLGALPPALRVEGPYLVIFPGASAALRQWPMERFAEAAEQLAGAGRLTVVLCGSGGERGLCEQLAAALRAPSVNLAGRTALWEFVEIVRGARLLVGNETSAIHVAAAVGTPSICILGGGHFGRFMPYAERLRAPHAPRAAVRPMACFGCNWQCTQPHVDGGPVPCITGVSVAEVVTQGRRMLSPSVAGTVTSDVLDTETVGD